MTLATSYEYDSLYIERKTIENRRRKSINLGYSLAIYYIYVYILVYIYIYSLPYIFIYIYYLIYQIFTPVGSA